MALAELLKMEQMVEFPVQPQSASVKNIFWAMSQNKQTELCENNQPAS